MEKIVYIGAGVSTQYGVLHLLKNGYDPKKIKIIEKGEDIYNRKSSEVMSGAGGAGTYSDFKIVKSWTQGGVFTPEYVDLETANRLGEKVIEYVKEYHPDINKIMYTEPAEVPQWLNDSVFDLKQSPVIHLGTDYGRKQVQNIFEFFDKEGIEQLYNCEVVDIDFKNNYLVYTDSEGNHHQEYYDRVVLAGGKSGVDFLDKIIKKYDLKTTPRAAQIGVRYETDGKYFEELTKFAYDFKLYIKWDKDVSGRTFCCNNFASFVAPELTYGNITFNGHALKDPSRFNGLTNFGIMLEVKNQIEDPYLFCKNLVSSFNKGGKGSSYSPTDRKPTKTDDGELIPCSPISLDELKKGFGSYFIHLYDFIQNLNETFKVNDDYILYIPEVKYLSNTLVMKPKDFSLIDYPNVHVQGDQSVSRGIWISSISGLYVAEFFLNNCKDA